MTRLGNEEARILAQRHVDLTRVSLSNAEAIEVGGHIEHALGMRCDGCGRRITVGFKFRSIDPRAAKPVIELYSCSREGCDFASQAREGATSVEQIEYVWLDVEPGAVDHVPTVAKFHKSD